MSCYFESDSWKVDCLLKAAREIFRSHWFNQLLFENRFLRRLQRLQKTGVMPKGNCKVHSGSTLIRNWRNPEGVSRDLEEIYKRQIETLIKILKKEVGQ